MKTLGIIGGVGPESTVDYYQTLIALYRARNPDGSYPAIVINSINMRRAVKAIEAGAFDVLGEFLLAELQRLERAGADFALLAANTPHIIFKELEARTPLPLLSIVDATCAAAQARNFKRIGLFGTRFTMQADFYRKHFSSHGLEIVVPEPADQDYLHQKYMEELVPGIFLPKTKAELLAIVDRLASRTGIEAVILGGTELPLILTEPEHNGIAFLNTTRIHCEAAVDRILS